MDSETEFARNLTSSPATAWVESSLVQCLKGFIDTEASVRGLDAKNRWLVECGRTTENHHASVYNTDTGI